MVGIAVVVLAGVVGVVVAEAAVGVEVIPDLEAVVAEIRGTEMAGARRSPYRCAVVSVTT